jgi:hypothetical protein
MKSSETLLKENNIPMLEEQESAANEKKVENILDITLQYVNAQVEYLQLQAVKKSSVAASTLASWAILFLIFGTLFLFLNIGLALWLGQWMGKYYYGFFALAGFYLVVGIVLYALRDKWIHEPVMNNLIRKFTS